MPQILDPRSLEIFLAIYDTRHFGRAAEDLYMTTPKLSRSLGTLERKVNATLFERGPGRPVSPTAEGHRFHGHAQRAWEELQALPSAATGDEAGTDAVRVGILGAGLGGADAAEVMRRWSERFPGVQLIYMPLSSYNHDTAVISRDVDIAVLGITGTEEDELLSHVAYSSQRAIVVPSDHPLADADLVHPEEIADLELAYSVVPGRLGEIWADVPVDQGRKDVKISNPADVSMTVFTTRRPANHSMAAAALGTVAGTRFVPLSGPEVQIGVQIRANEQRPAVLALYDIVRLCTITGPDPTSPTV